MSVELGSSVDRRILSLITAASAALIYLLLGMLYMLYRKIISWHIPVSILTTVFIFTGILWLANPDRFADPLFHLLTGGLMLGAIYMATDPVSAPGMRPAKWIYGFLICVLTILIRVFNPAFPEGIMLAILFMNLFSPLLDYLFIKRRIKNRIANV